MKRILITGANSYIGTSFERYMSRFGADYSVDTLNMLDSGWSKKDFSSYDVIFHVAGIAHIKETDENREMYYKVNRDLTLKVAEKARNEGVGHFAVLSTMSVYGKLTGKISKDTPCLPVNAYGKSKLMADRALMKMNSADFAVSILRPPMVYGKGCKGNYQQLRSFALKSPVFPSVKNERSMIYIGNLCEFVKNLIDNPRAGIFHPQNSEYVNTSRLVKEIAALNGKKIRLWSVFNPFVKIAPLGVTKKVFGSLVYEKTDTVDKYGFEESVKLSEN